jgi:hypothetical protein
VRKCEDEEQAKVKDFCEDCVRLNVRANTPHSAGCCTTPGSGAMNLESTREMGEGGVTVEPADELESKLPVDEQDPPRDEMGLNELLESLF